MGKMRFVSIGECMAELQLAHDGLYSLAFGGDTLNTSWYVRALAAVDTLEVEFLTAVGSDPLSDKLIDFLNEHKIGTNHIKKIMDRNLGLYLISLAGAERSFTYWRNSSAAKLVLENKTNFLSAVSNAYVIYFSGVTLAILSPEHRKFLLDHMQQLKAAGAIIAFDSNTRPKLWTSEQDMKEAMILGYQAATIALPTFIDEQALFGDATPAECAKRIASYGVREIIVKDGANACTCLVGDALFEVNPSPVKTMVDTTGAGDSFNAGYLVGRMVKMDCLAAANLGHRVAGLVICHRGALVPAAIFVDLKVS